MLRYPITALVIAAAVGLHAAVLAYEWRHPENASEAFHVLGAATTRMIVVEPGLYGHFTLWNGELWRVFVSGFHHADLLHLGFNVLTLAFLGSLLEPRMSRLGYLLFVAAANVIALTPEFLLENDAVGLSGVTCAMFGALLVLRREDDELLDWLSDPVVGTGLFLIVACVPLTWLGLLPVANIAHFTGLGYGWIAGRTALSAVSRPVGRWSFVAAHLLLVPVGYLLMHPIANGRYEFYQALDTLEFDERKERLRAAVRLEPGLGGAWAELAEMQRFEGERQQAWETALTGLRSNRSHPELLRVSRTIWRGFLPGEEQSAALDNLERVFRDEAAAWSERLGAVPFVDFRWRLFAEQRRAAAAFSLQPRIELPATLDGRDKGRERDLMAPPVDPAQPGSAAEGVAL